MGSRGLYHPKLNPYSGTSWMAPPRCSVPRRVAKREERESACPQRNPQKYFQKVQKLDFQIVVRKNQREDMIHHKLTTKKPPQNTSKVVKPPVKTTSIPLPTFFSVQTQSGRDL
jgi:hypothetical protein